MQFHNAFWFFIDIYLLTEKAKYVVVLTPVSIFLDIYLSTGDFYLWNNAALWIYEMAIKIFKQEQQVYQIRQ